MKKFLNRRNIIGIIAIAALFACGGAVYGGINSQDADRGSNPLYMENSNHKEVFPEGKGYSLSKTKAQEYQLPEKNQKQEDVITGSSSSSFNFSSSSFSSGRPFSFSSRTRIKIDTTPTLKTDLDENKAYSDVTGSELSFYIEPRLFGGGYLKEEDIIVKYDGKELKGRKSGSSSYSYSTTILKGEKYVEVTINDVKQKKKLEKKYKIIGTAEKTYSVSGSEAIDSFSDIKLTPYSIEIKKGDTVKVSEVISSMLEGSDYFVTETSDHNKKIEAISGFGDFITLSESVIEDLEAEGFTADKDFYGDEIDITETDGEISTDSILPEGSRLTGSWVIFMVSGKEETEINYNDSLKNLKGDTTIYLRYVIEEMAE